MLPAVESSAAATPFPHVRRRLTCFILMAVAFVAPRLKRHAGLA